MKNIYAILQSCVERRVVLILLRKIDRELIMPGVNIFKLPENEHREV